MTVAHINLIGTALPPNEVHQTFVEWAERRIADSRVARLFRRTADRSGIARRWSVLAPTDYGSQVEAGFYAGAMPSTAARMAVYAEEAPRLALQAVHAVGELGDVSHIVVASCTGFVAPGIDQILARGLGLPASVERTMIGFMGCYAAVAALRTAHHIVRSEPHARVLVITVELCTLHLQGTDSIEPLLAMLQFGDGAAAAIVSAEPSGLALDHFFARAVPDSHELIQWTIGDEGFVMQLAGAVPGRIRQALADHNMRALLLDDGPIDAWAVHAGGRSVLDAVQQALDLPPEALDHSRAVLAANGNISSATLMFVLARFLATPPSARGIGLAFGPGLAAEGFAFRAAA